MLKKIQNNTNKTTNNKIFKYKLKLNKYNNKKI